MANAFDAREAGRFVVSGIVASLGNLAAVFVTREMLGFHTALMCGIAAGMTLSFLLARFFAFRPARPQPGTAKATAAQTARFGAVYAAGLLLYFGVALGTRAALGWLAAAPVAAELGGAAMGAAAMALSGYFGHRFFTFATHRAQRV